MSEQANFLLKVGNAYLQVYRNTYERCYWVPFGNGSRISSSFEKGKTGIMEVVAKMFNVPVSEIKVVYR